MMASLVKNKNPFYTFPTVDNDQSITISDNSWMKGAGFIDWNIANDQAILSDNLRKTLGIPDEKKTICWQDWINLSHPDEIDMILHEMRALTGLNNDYLSVKRRKKCTNGTYLTFLIQAKVLNRGQDNVPTRLAATCIDITQHEDFRKKIAVTEHLFHIMSQLHAHSTADISLNKLLQEIYNSFKKFTHGKGLISIFSANNSLIESVGDDMLGLPGLSEVMNIVLKSKKRTVITIDDKSYVVVYVSLPSENYGIVLLEHEAKNSDILELIEPIIQTAHYLINLRMQSNIDQQKENILRLIIKQIQAPIAILDTNMRYLASSDAWVREYCVNADTDIVGKLHYDILPNQPESWMGIHQTALEGKVFYGGEECYYTSSGKAVWLTGSIHPWYIDEKTIGGIIIFTEIITNRKDSEKRLGLMVNELMRSNQDLERFAHICSHDLKEPLRSVSGFIELLINQNSDNFDETSLTYIPHIIKGLNRMDNLIKGILEYSKISHNVEKDMQIDMSGVLCEIKESLALQIQQLDATINSESMPIIEGDHIKIKQIFTNLIENSLKFHSKQKPIIDISYENKGNFWEFSIKDNGVGIEGRHLKDVFEIFTRLHNKDQYEGSGVGLSIVKKNVNAHGGDIFARPNPTGGSEFVFTLQKHKCK